MVPLIAGFAAEALLPPYFSGGKLEKISKELSALSDVSAVEKLLIKNKVEPTLVQKYAEKFANEKDLSKTKAMFEGLQREQKALTEIAPKATEEKLFSMDKKLSPEEHKIFDKKYSEFQDSLNIEPSLKEHLPESITAREVVSKIQKSGVLGEETNFIADVVPELQKLGYSGIEKNKIPKFIEEVQARIVAIANDINTKAITKEQGVKLLNGVKNEMKKMNTPLSSFGAVAGFETDEKGNVTFNPEKALIGIAAVGAFTYGGKNLAKKDLYDAYEEINALKTAVNENPAKQLQKYAIEGKTKLPEVLGGKEAKGIYGKRGDDIITELGFKDTFEAEKAFDEYRKLNSKL